MSRRRGLREFMMMSTVLPVLGILALTHRSWVLAVVYFGVAAVSAAYVRKQIH